MAVQIVINQAAHAAGVAGVAREDLATGTDVTLSASGGPFLSHLWRVIHKPIDIFAGVRSTAVLATPTFATTVLTPIDKPGTYHVELSVDSGHGLGATVDDVTRITFYAGTAGSKLFGPLSATPEFLPRRIMAFQETTEHNVADAIEATGNTEGWSREWYRWFASIQRMWEGKSWAAGRVALPGGGPATLTRGFNIATVTRFAQGVVDVAFTTALPDANYAVLPTARGATGGSCTVTLETTAGFRVSRADLGGSLVDADFTFDVKLGI